MFTEEALSHIVNSIFPLLMEKPEIKRAIKQWPELMQLKIASEYMGCGVSSVIKLIQSGKITNASFDSRIRVRKSDLDSYLESL